MALDALLSAEFTFGKSMAILLGVAVLASFDLSLRMRHRPTHLLFACVCGTLLSIGMITVVEAFLRGDGTANAHASALGIVLVVLLWKALFGPWGAQTKAAVLGTFLFWISLHALLGMPPQERLTRLLAAAVAFIPAGVWACLFLKYHAERFSAVLLMFFAGMLSTFPILLYDALVRKGIEFQFFLLRVTPESFSRSSHAFVSGQLASSGIRSALLTSFVSFILVGVIEEISKYWVLSRSGRRLFSSIDDVLQLSIIVAIGFAFAENVVNPAYFPGFVREYLLRPGGPDFLSFISNVLGRSVLTSMVHIVSTGVLGYFVGLALFAGPYIAERRKGGHAYRLLRWMHRCVGLDESATFRAQMLLTGILSAIALHTVFNFLVTLPDLLPGNPSTIGELFKNASLPVVGWVPLLIIPSMLYVVGGFWLLSALFLRKQNMQERGHLITQDVYVNDLSEG